MEARSLVTVCRELIDIESVSGNEAALEAYVRSALPPSFEIAYEHDSVLFARSARRPGAELVVLAGHTDTVPVADNIPSQINGDVISGCGASDMKSGLAVMLELTRWFDRTRPDAAFDLGVLFFGREELPASHCPLLAALDAPIFGDISMAILMEPTDNAIEAGCMGNLNLRVTFNGTAAHSARPWLGDNAIHKGIVALAAFAQQQPAAVEVDGLQFTEVASVTEFAGGVALNVIPDRAQFFVNIRYSPARSPEEAESMWCKYFAALDAEVAVIGNAHSAPVSLDHPYVKQLQRAGANSVRPKQAWTNVADFATHGVTAINFGPGDPKFAHRADEQINVSALDASLTILQNFVTGREQ